MSLSPQQTAAAESGAERICIIAGPGSGKTRTLVARVMHLIASGVAPSRICVVTFTNEAARELERRLAALLGERFIGGCRLGYCGTLHGLMLRYVQAQSEQRLAVADEEQVEAMLNASIRRLKYIGTKEALYEVLARGPHGIGRSMTKAEVVAADFWQEMESAGLIDFDSILHRGLHAVLTFGSGREFGYLLVDETQDTGRMDWKIYEALPVGNKLFVGDTDQSIYGFRGGSPEFLRMLATDTRYSVHYLNGNYRCGAHICDAANAVIANAANRLPKHTESLTGRAGLVRHTEYADGLEEIAGLAALMKESGDYEDIAVLLRLNAHVEIYARGLAAMGVPVRRRTVEEKPEDWRDARRLLALCANPANDWLVFDWLRNHAGEDYAKAVKRTAAANFATLNEVCNSPMPENMTVAQAIVEMGKAALSKASIERAERMAAALPADATVNELCVALAADTSGTDEGSGVTVGTMHSAKGREWRTVFLPAFEQSIFPANRDVDEERRVCFVAFTRAKEALHISHARQRPNLYRTFQMDRQEPSQFIAEAEL